MFKQFIKLLIHSIIDQFVYIFKEHMHPYSFPLKPGLLKKTSSSSINRLLVQRACYFQHTRSAIH